MDGKNITLLSCRLLALLVLISAQLSGQGTTVTPEQAAAYHSLGIGYFRDDDLDSAVHYFKLAAQSREILLADAPTIDLGKSNFNAGGALFDRSDFADAIPFLRRALEVYTTIDLPPDQRHRIPETRQKLAEAMAATGDFSAAEAQLQLAISMARLETEATMTWLAGIEAKCLGTLGGLYFQQDRLAEARATLQRTLLVYDSLAIAGHDLTEDRITPETDLASTLNKLGKYPEAERYYLRVLDVYRALGNDSNAAITANNLAELRVKTGNFAGAEAMLRLGGDAARRTGIPQYLAQNEDHRGALLLAQGKPEQAAAAFQRAQAILLPEYAPESIAETPPLAQLKYADNQTDLFLYLLDQARALDAMNVGGAGLAAAQLAAYRTADALLDELRLQHSGQATKLFWREKALPFYEDAIRVCHQTNDGPAAFFFFEKSKAVLLHEALLDSDALRDLPDVLRQREKTLARAVTAARKNLASASTADANGLETLTSARQALTNFRDSLRDGFPRYRALTEKLPAPTLPDFRQRILAPAGQTLVHYFSGPTNTYALVVDATGARTFSLGRSDALLRVTSTLLAYFTAAADIQNDPAGYAAAAHAAYQAILKPLALPEGQALLIIPDGPLTYLPFPALLTDSPTEANRLGQLPYLLHRHPVTYCHSASIVSRSVSDPEVTAILAMAPFTDGSTPAGYPVLPFSQDELNTISEQFTTTLLKDGAATLAAFRANNAAAGILHLSTHAYSSPETDAPLIAFYDQPLYLRDLYHEDISADLVVLSACQTNIGRLARGEGVLGLGRGFIQAGAQSIIASLWNVNARGSGRVLADFYQQLAAGKTKGMALHGAQLAYLADPALRDQDKSPYLWAGLTYYGAEKQLQLSPRRRWDAFLLGALSALLVLGGAWWWDRRRATARNAG